MVDELIVGQLYSNEEIITSLNVGNAGGIRLSAPAGDVVRAAIMTADEGLHGTGEKPTTIDWRAGFSPIQRRANLANKLCQVRTSA